MKTVTVRDVQHRFRELLELVSGGQSIQVTRRGRVVARITPPEAPANPTMPDFMARLKKTFPTVPEGKPASQIISEQREELR